MRAKITPSSPSSICLVSEDGSDGEVVIENVPEVDPPNEAFSEYLWMEHEDEFNDMFMRELEEEALMEQCVQSMLDDEKEEEASLGNDLSTQMERMRVVDRAELARKSTLNPYAAEFIPGSS